MSDNMDMQYFDFPETESFRYFKVICNTVYRDKPRCALFEVGVYHR